MADTHETIADIIAEKRRRADEIERDCAEKMKRGEMVSDCYARELVADIRREADRLDAAYKREKAAIEADALAVGGIVEAARKRERGDCAKLREALKDIVRIVEQIHLLYSDFPYEIHDIVRKARAALAAPARNCDKVKTSWDVLKEWHEGLDTANDVVRLLDWLLAPATEKEGGAK